MKCPGKIGSTYGYLFIAACVAFTPITGCGGGSETSSQQITQGKLLPILNASFEQGQTSSTNCISGWKCFMHSDPTSFRFAYDTTVFTDGKQSLLIEQLKPEPFGYAAQEIIATEYVGKKMLIQADVRTEGVSGNGGGIFYIAGGTIANIANGQKYILGTQNWQPLKLEFVVPGNARVLTVGASLEGSGRLWVDNISLSTAP